MNTLYLYTWNVLTPYIYANQMTWKDCNSKLELAKLDLKRFKHRLNVIIKIIDYWLNDDKVVICLQEVSEQLLLHLLHIKTINVYCSTSKKLTDKDSFIVTIVKGYESSFTEINIVDRSLLKVSIDDIDIFNVHLYWKWTDIEISQVGEIIDSNCRPKFIICGDFNKQISELDSLLNNISCIYIIPINGYTIKRQTEKKIIDHIFISSTINITLKPKIIRKILNYKIMYNIKRLCMLYDKNLLTLQSWIKYRKNNDISDHLPITIKINFNQNLP